MRRLAKSRSAGGKKLRRHLRRGSRSRQCDFKSRWCTRNTHHEHHDVTRFGALVAPSMPCAVLDDGVSSAQVNGGTIIQLEPHLTRDDVLKVFGVGRVHARTLAFHVLDEAGQFGFELRTQDFSIHLCKWSLQLRRNGKRHEAESANWWEVLRVRRWAPVIWKLGRAIRAPKSVKRDSRKSGKGETFYCGVADKDGLALRVVPRSHSSNLHCRLATARLVADTCGRKRSPCCPHRPRRRLVSP